MATVILQINPLCYSGVVVIVTNFIAIETKCVCQSSSRAIETGEKELVRNDINWN